MINGSSKLIISGNNMDLTDALKNLVEDKVERLFRHESHIIRVRVDLEYDPHSSSHKNEFIAHGHIEINGPDMTCTAQSDDMHKSIDDMVNKLDRMIRRRSRLRKVKRKNTHGVDIPANIPKVA